MPEGGRIVVSDTTPLIALAVIDRIEILGNLYGEIRIPRAVLNEIVAGGERRPGPRAIQVASWIRVADLADPSRAALLADLDRGEAEVIALAQEVHADLVLVDERLARAHLRRLGVSITGVVGVLLKAKKEGLISEVAPLLTELKRGGIWLGQGLVQEALDLAGE